MKKFALSMVALSLLTSTAFGVCPHQVKKSLFADTNPKVEAVKTDTKSQGKSGIK